MSDAFDTTRTDEDEGEDGGDHFNGEGGGEVETLRDGQVELGHLVCWGLGRLIDYR